MTRYRIHLIVEVTDAHAVEAEAMDWDDVAKKVKARLMRGGRQPLDKEGWVRIQYVAIDTAEEPDDAR